MRPEKLKNLPADEMPALCEENPAVPDQKAFPRQAAICPPNLGVVELTVALHRVLDFPQDKLLFDVGHQCYTHKLLTGRRAGLRSCAARTVSRAFPARRRATVTLSLPGTAALRCLRPSASPGPKSSKIEPGKVVVIVGDGAFTGGMVYEGMNNVSKLNNLIVILNDNKMSISKMSARWPTI